MHTGTYSALAFEHTKYTLALTMSRFRRSPRNDLSPRADQGGDGAAVAVTIYYPHVGSCAAAMTSSTRLYSITLPESCSGGTPSLDALRHSHIGIKLINVLSVRVLGERLDWRGRWVSLWTDTTGTHRAKYDKRMDLDKQRKKRPHRVALHTPTK